MDVSVKVFSIHPGAVTISWSLRSLGVHTYLEVLRDACAELCVSRLGGALVLMCMSLSASKYCKKPTLFVEAGRTQEHTYHSTTTTKRLQETSWMKLTNSQRYLGTLHCLRTLRECNSISPPSEL